MQRRAVHSHARKVVLVDAVMAPNGEVRSHVDGVGGDRYRSGEIHLLPAGVGLTREGSRCQQRAVARPEIADMRADIGARLEEADTRNVAAGICVELNSQLHRAVRTGVNNSGDRRAGPDSGVN